MGTCKQSRRSASETRSEVREREASVSRHADSARVVRACRILRGGGGGGLGGRSVRRSVDGRFTDCSPTVPAYGWCGARAVDAGAFRRRGHRRRRHWRVVPGKGWRVVPCSEPRARVLWSGVLVARCTHVHTIHSRTAELLACAGRARRFRLSSPARPPPRATWRGRDRDRGCASGGGSGPRGR